MVKQYKLDSLAEVLAQVVHFSRDDYYAGFSDNEYPEAVAWSAAYICACLLAQHTKHGMGGVESEYPYRQLRITEDITYVERLKLAEEAVDYWNTDRELGKLP